MKDYLFAVQTASGREVLATRASVKRVSEVTAEVTKEGVLEIRQKGAGVIGKAEDVPEGELTLYRWFADKKLDEPVAHEVTRLDASTV